MPLPLLNSGRLEFNNASKFGFCWLLFRVLRLVALMDSNCAPDAQLEFKLASIKFEGGWMFGFLLVLGRFLQIKLLQVSVPILSSGSMPAGVRDKLLDFSSFFVSLPGVGDYDFFIKEIVHRQLPPTISNQIQGSFLLLSSV